MLYKVASKRVDETFLKELETEFDAIKNNFKVNTFFREAMFWAQMSHETGGFKWMAELGGKMYFKKYDGRADLGNVRKGDGYKFKGRGLIHITGRYNYTKYGRMLGVDLIKEPTLAATPKIAVKIALLYWRDRNLNKYADLQDIRAVTKRINGGYNGLADRKRRYETLLESLN